MKVEIEYIDECEAEVQISGSIVVTRDKLAEFTTKFSALVDEYRI